MLDDSYFEQRSTTKSTNHSPDGNQRHASPAKRSLVQSARQQQPFSRSRWADTSKVRRKVPQWTPTDRLALMSSWTITASQGSICTHENSFLGNKTRHK